MAAKINHWKRIKGWVDKAKTVFEVVKLAKFIWALLFAAAAIGYNQMKDTDNKFSKFDEAIKKIERRIDVVQDSFTKPVKKEAPKKEVVIREIPNPTTEKEIEQIKKDIENLKGWHE